MILTQENNYGMMKNKLQTKSTEALKHSIMNIKRWDIGENIVSFIQNHFVNKVDQVLLPKQFYMKEKFVFH